MGTFSTPLRTCGIVLIVFGVLGVFLGIASIPVRVLFYRYGFTFWAALFFILDGSLAISVSLGRGEASGMTITCLVLAIISIVFAALLIGFSSYGVILDEYFLPRADKHLYRGIIAIHALDILIGVGGCITALCLSIFCCLSLSKALNEPHEQMGLHKRSPHQGTSNDYYGSASEP